MSTSESTNSQDQSIGSSLSDADAIVNSYVHEITKENIPTYLENAKELVDKKEYIDASLIYKALIIKGEEIYQSERAFELAEFHIKLGECLLNDCLVNGELVGKEGE